MDNWLIENIVACGAEEPDMPVACCRHSAAASQSIRLLLLNTPLNPPSKGESRGASVMGEVRSQYLISLLLNRFFGALAQTPPIGL